MDLCGLYDMLEPEMEALNASMRLVRVEEKLV